MLNPTLSYIFEKSISMASFPCKHHFWLCKNLLNSLSILHRLNSRRASRGRGIYEEQDLIVPYQGLKKPGAPGEFNEIRFNGVDDQRVRP